jgi:hypothetical protein
LLALLKEAQKGNEAREAERVRRHALLAQVRDGLELLQQQRFDESLQVLRAVLREDPDSARAQAAIQEVRRAWLARQAAPPARRPTPPQPLAPVAPAVRAPAPLAARAPTAEPAPGATTRRAGTVLLRPARAAPPEILLPRTRQRATPFGVILVVGSLLAVLWVLVARRPGVSVSPRRVEDATATAPTPTPAGPLASLDPDLREAIESTLAAYGRAVEMVDAAALEAARPDMTREAREARLTPFRGAINAATDLRVLDVQIQGDVAVVEVLASDVIVGGRQQARPPTGETLRFARRPEGWRLVAER